MRTRVYWLTYAPTHRNCTGPVSNLIDFVPLLQILPNSLTTRAKKLHNDLVDTYGGMINAIEAQMNAGEEVPECLAKTLVETRNEENFDHLDMAILCSAFMIGGIETVGSSHRCDRAITRGTSVRLRPVG